VINLENIPLSIPFLNGNEWEYIKECLDTNWVSSVGKYVEKFEDDIAAYIGTDYAVATVNGTAALHMALKVLGVEAGDKVLVPTLTFIASVNPIRYCNADPVFVDSERETYNMDPEKLEEKIKALIAKGNRPKAAVIVHLYGHPAKMDQIIDICKKYDIKVIEDATESLGSEYKGKKTGSIGDIGCFSFNGNKLITTGGGGMLVTDNEKWADKVKYLTTQAKDDPEQFIHHEVGYNYRLTNIQAAMGVAQLEQIEDFINKKREIAHKYNELLSNIEGIKINPDKDWAFNNYWLYSILIDEEKFGMDSKQLYNKLNEAGIMSRPFFKPIHNMPMYKDCDKTNTDNAAELWWQGINLPCSVSLDISKVEYISEKIKEIKEKQ
jgi:aminotransferase in exopolysaccharide biosynthesis